MRYEAFNAGVFDLGVSSSLLYSVFHQPFALYVSNQPALALNKIIYFLLAPFFNIYPDPRVLLVFQSFFIPLSIFPLYDIAKHVFKDEYISIFIAITYLFYYPMGGVNWFDFHFMALVPALFLFGFYFLLKQKYWISAVFLVLAEISDFLVPLVGIILSIVLFFTKDKKQHKFSIFMLIFSTLLFAMIVLYFGASYLFYWANYKSIPYYFLMINASWQLKALFLIYMFSPLLFIPILDKKYVYLIIPFLAFALLNNYYPYIDPMFFQYPSLIAPFLFISLIFGLKNLSLKFRKINIKNVRRIAVMILALNIAIAMVLMPWGPFNPDITSSYNMDNAIHVTVQDQALDKMITLIPKGSSVLIQDNMPQLAIIYNWTLPDFLKNGTYPDYIITDPYSYFFDHYSVYNPLYNQTMIQVFNMLFSTGKYSVYAESYGMILLKINYHGSPIMFTPFTMNVPGSANISFIAPGNYKVENASENATLQIIYNGSMIMSVKAGSSFHIAEYLTGLKIILKNSATAEIVQYSC
jgi:uncharacterized membrane protein